MGGSNVADAEHPGYKFVGRMNNEFLNAKCHKTLNETYDRLTGENYDEGMNAANWQAPAELANAVNDHVKDKTATFLDVGAGTGSVGEELRKRGFTGKIDGLEPSLKLVDTCKAKNVYTNIYTDIFVLPDKEIPIQKESYDNVVASGVIVPGHVSYKCIRQLLTLVKKGGYLISSMRAEYMGQEAFAGFKDMVDELSAAGVCEYHAVEFPVYYMHHPGLALVFKKL